MARTVEAELLSGRRVGPYRLLFRLGKGGMGEVWAAQRAGQFGFERLVALKILLGGPADPNNRVMFFDEARATSALQHPAIVPTFDLGEDNGTFYIAMEMIRGPSLTGLLQRLAVSKTPIPPAIVAYIGQRLASALDYAYDRAEIEGKRLRLIHRDISPHNVLLDESGNVLLTDFGVARTAVQDHESRVGTVRGKPSYMAPEQVVGAAIDARTDVFALAVVLYECASVKRLFGRSNPVKSMEAVVHHMPRPLSDLIPGFPGELSAIIARALQKDPSRRYASGGELARALSDASRSLPGAATASPDLAALIAEQFPPGSFDVDAKVSEALAEAAAAAGNHDHETHSQIEVRVKPTASSAADVDSPLPELVGTRVAWPMASASDPLDPDALAEVRAQIGTPKSAPTGLTPSSSSAVVQTRSPLASWAVVAAAFAAVIVASAAYMVSRNKSEVVPKEHAAEPPALEAVVRPGARGSPAREPVVTSDGEVVPPSDPAVARRAAKRVLTNRRAPETGRPREAPLTGKTSPVESAPATRTEVFGLISRLEALDPTLAKSMKATLAESGGNSTTLESLRRQATEALERAQGH